jgi:hypothetical protein
MKTDSWTRLLKAINAAMGGVVLPNPHGYENGVLHVEFSETGKAFFGRDGMDVAEAAEDGIKEYDERVKVMLVHGVGPFLRLESVVGVSERVLLGLGYRTRSRLGNAGLYRRHTASIYPTTGSGWKDAGVLLPMASRGRSLLVQSFGSDFY